MLHQETVTTATLDLIRKLQADPVFESFSLVGGTALSLQIGHRIKDDGVKMLSKQDIAAFKVNAITGSGTRTKDFVDIYFLLKQYSFEEVVGFYTMKYGQRNEFHAIKSLTYFDDLDPSDWPNLVLEKNLTIGKVKDTIISHRNKYLRQG